MDIKRAIAEAKVEFPDLGVFGFGENVDEAFDHAQIETVIEFLRFCRPTKQATRVSSYWLKHIVEQWGRSVGLEPYITNGAAIVGASAVGFMVRRVAGNCNAAIGINKHDLDLIQKRMRHKQMMG